jgi:hypothetical protein
VFSLARLLRKFDARESKSVSFASFVSSFVRNESMSDSVCTPWAASTWLITALAVTRSRPVIGPRKTQVAAVRLGNGLEKAIAQQSGSGRKIAVRLFLVLVLLAHCRIGEWIQIQRTGSAKNRREAAGAGLP